MVGWVTRHAPKRVLALCTQVPDHLSTCVLSIFRSLFVDVVFPTLVRVGKKVCETAAFGFEKTSTRTERFSGQASLCGNLIAINS